MATELYEQHVGNGADRGKEWSVCWRKDHIGKFAIGSECPECMAERKPKGNKDHGD